MAINLTVIGAGPGGYMAAIRAAQLGAKVTVVEQGPTGGVCLNWGCIPTKALRATAEAMDTAHDLARMGIVAEGPFRVDLPAAMARKDEVVATLVGAVEKLFEAHGVELVRGRAELDGPGRVKAHTADGIREIAHDRLIIASGSLPAHPPGLEPDGTLILDSTAALALREVPESMAIVGGGVIGCEFAGIFSALGSRVTVIEALDRLLPLDSIDDETSKVLQRELKKRGVKAITGAMVGRVSPEGDGATLELGPSALAHKPIKKPQSIAARVVLVSVGRRLATAGMGLESAGVALDERGAVLVDEHLQTSVPGIYAIGDCLGAARPMLAHLAGAEGRVAAANALGQSQVMDYAVVPSAIFTTPEAASVGLTQRQADEQGIEAESVVFQFRQLGKSQAMGRIAGHVKLVCAPGGGRLLGAHLIGPHATDIIAECALAIRLGATAADVAHTIHAHPTLAEGVAEAAEMALGQCLHAPPRG